MGEHIRSTPPLTCAETSAPCTSRPSRRSTDRAGSSSLQGIPPWHERRRHVQRETEKMVLCNADKTFALCTVSMKAISEMANKDGWSDNARNGVISFDSCSLNAGIDHDHATNVIVEGDESRCISSLSQMFEVLANRVNSTAEDLETDPKDAKSNSILDELKLAQEHLVFEWTSTNPETKCSEIGALINVELSYLCENVNNLADICNGRHERHTPVNTVERQHNLFRILD